MRTKRLIDNQGVAYYHCLSRVIEKRFIFDEAEREHFRKLMRRQEAFSGVRVLTWTCMSNHFHVLVAVEEKTGKKVQEELQRLMDDDATFIARLKHLYTPKALEDIEKVLKFLRKAPNPDQMDADGDRSKKHREWRKKQIARVKQPFLDRMHDLSCFVGELKQRISQRYNLKNERKGPLWEDRFKSVLVQGTPGVLATVAAYIDLNAVRAGIVKEPKEWRWCGYAEAAAAQCLAREGIYEVLGEPDDASRDGAGWRRVHHRYRALLVCESVQRRDEEGRIVRKGLSPEEVEAAEERGFAPTTSRAAAPSCALFHRRTSAGKRRVPRWRFQKEEALAGHQAKGRAPSPPS
jgi:putative transposase